MLVLGCSSLIFLFFIIVRHCWRCPGSTPGDLSVESIAGFLRIVDGTSTGSGISESAASLGLPGRPFSLGGRASLPTTAGGSRERRLESYDRQRVPWHVRPVNAAIYDNRVSPTTCNRRFAAGDADSPSGGTLVVHFSDLGADAAVACNYTFDARAWPHGRVQLSLASVFETRTDHCDLCPREGRVEIATEARYEKITCLCNVGRSVLIRHWLFFGVCCESAL
ncbi:hypothetical protein HPB52_005508 [Rhipicephalus sanguineus]|uniref:Secreted protein n=1 Tax=Rhipicephalus sanguineus TaxID=34632 RepID=A0A9D4PHH5_RHISA|nr:hypothetical protein HPB52_005508 [Rhipicephalus sanguineus]